MAAILSLLANLPTNAGTASFQLRAVTTAPPIPENEIPPNCFVTNEGHPISNALLDSDPDKAHLPPLRRFHLHDFLDGPEGHKHFIFDQGSWHCLRATCNGCSLTDSCESEPASVQITPLPHPRRGLGREQKPFLTLTPTWYPADRHNLTTWPKLVLSALPHELSPEGLDEASLIFVFDPPGYKLRILKGQFRYYGTPEQLATEPYAAHFSPRVEYTPSHLVVALDLASIEPKVTTIVSQEPEWLKVFQGTSKTIFREITLATGTTPPKHSVSRNGKTYCYLIGEMDKESFDGPRGQCTKCKITRKCLPTLDYTYKVAGDWHGINRDAFYDDVLKTLPKTADGGWTEAAKDKLKALRAIAKIVGLAVTYGGTEFTVANNMGETKERAKTRIERFFVKLTGVKRWMDNAEAGVMVRGYVENLFGRRRDMTWATNPPEDMDWKDRRKKQAYARRTALNHPIQSTALEILKIGMLRTTTFIQKHKLNPFANLHLDQTLPAGTSYKDTILALITTNHDETDTIIRQDKFDEIIPPLYKELQLFDIMEKLKAPFSLEMDVEYDETGSWTGKSRYDTSRVHLLNSIPSTPPQEPTVTI